MQKALIITGVIILVIGLLWTWLSKLPLGRLPGDIVVRAHFRDCSKDGIDDTRTAKRAMLRCPQHFRGLRNSTKVAGGCAESLERTVRSVALAH